MLLLQRVSDLSSWNADGRNRYTCSAWNRVQELTRRFSRLRDAGDPAAFREAYREAQSLQISVGGSTRSPAGGKQSPFPSDRNVIGLLVRWLRPADVCALMATCWSVSALFIIFSF